uniref:Uncharacterized protein n=1 Tax=Utricularia reniformis TaxID=192314 RepID=A0A1Y0AZ94_9LAMI|nr:hypothetical protein AEK19_MT0178 [Utricularia reniformis]ART30460.1 hypothetical protein AEK19_MT0178 [Utricularia reniformis]
MIGRSTQSQYTDSISIYFARSLLCFYKTNRKFGSGYSRLLV